MSDQPEIVINLVLKQMKIQLATAFNEHTEVLSAQATEELNQVLNKDYINKLMQQEAEKFVHDVVRQAFADYNLKRSLAVKIARKLEADVKKD